MPVFNQTTGTRYLGNSNAAGGGSLNEHESGALRNVSISNTWRGIYIAVGDLNSGAAIDVIKVAGISLPKSGLFHRYRWTRRARRHQNQNDV